MTLVTPSRRRPPAYHKKISGSHHRRSKTYHKTYWPYLPMLVIALSGAILNTSYAAKHAVLGYATDMSVQSLLDDTNTQRTANSEATLSLNQQLDNAAQAKANDMAARDYWSHNTPDGQTPWSFMTAAGYNYQLAGENLAYGFATASDTITGWMNSPEHRANILDGGYKDVGFGFINITNYQNSGPETLVVAMYGAQASTAPAVAASPQPAAGGTTATPPNTTTSASGAPVAQTPAPTASNPAPTLTQTDVVTPAATQAALKTAKSEDISRIQVLTAGKASWSMFVLSLAGAAALLVFLLRHGLAWHKIFVKGERFLLHHPAVDVGLVATVTIAYTLMQQSGVIR